MNTAPGTNMYELQQRYGPFNYLSEKSKPHLLFHFKTDEKQLIFTYNIRFLSSQPWAEQFREVLKQSISKKLWIIERMHKRKKTRKSKRKNKQVTKIELHQQIQKNNN